MGTLPVTVPGIGQLASPRARHRLVSLGLILCALCIWQVVAVTVFAGRFVVPAPLSVISKVISDNFYLSDLLVTLQIAAKGWLLGNGAALALAAICLVLPSAEAGLITLGVATYCVPTIAVGPLLVVVAGPNGAKVLMSALSVFFVTLVAAVTGLRAASPTSLEMVTAFGGGPWQQLFKVRLRASIPTLASGLCISAPAAILGAMLGDYLGGQNGLGVIMLQAQQQLAVDRTWAIALVSTVVCGLAFGLTTVLLRKLGTEIDVPLDSGVIRQRRYHSRPVSFGLGLLRLLGAVVVGLLVWEAVIKASGLSSYFVKSPLDVWNYLAAGDASEQNRTLLLEGLVQTLKDGGLGWIAGMLAAILAASALVLFPPVGTAVMPIVVVLRSVPLIAMCPLLGLVFGREQLGITIIAATVTFVPSLVTMVNGLRTAPAAATDIIHCAGGGAWATLLKVRGPFSAPSFFAAAKISMPGALLGAVLAEWLITGLGLGHAMAYDVITSNFGNLWASMVTIVIVSLGLYVVVGAMENAVRGAQT
jgi:ABC-type nitrate/sulfonate/bicarbonate transport system permease component